MRRPYQQSSMETNVKTLTFLLTFFFSIIALSHPVPPLKVTTTIQADCNDLADSSYEKLEFKLQNIAKIKCAKNGLYLWEIDFHTDEYKCVNEQLKGTATYSCIYYF